MIEYVDVFECQGSELFNKKKLCLVFCNVTMNIKTKKIHFCIEIISSIYNNNINLNIQMSLFIDNE